MQHFYKASKDEKRQGAEKATYLGSPFKLCITTFVNNLALMADIMKELKKLSKHYKTGIPHFQRRITYYLYIQYKTNIKPSFFPERGFYFGSACSRSNVVSGGNIERKQKPRHPSVSVRNPSAWYFDFSFGILGNSSEKDQYLGISSKITYK